MNEYEKKVLKKSQAINHWSAQKLYYCIDKIYQRKWTVKRGEVYFVDLGENITNHYSYVDNKNITKYLSGTIDLGQIKTIGKERIISKRICLLTTEMKEIDSKIFHVFGMSHIIRAKDNTIQSLNGKIEYLKSELKK